MPDSSSRIVIADDLGREHVFDVPPRRIVSLVPSLTETLVFLSALKKLVGITDYCIHPEEALTAVPRIGGTKNPDTGKILTLSPDLVIANKEENQKRHIEILEEKVRVFVTYPRSVREVLKTVQDLGMLVEAQDKAEQFSAKCEILIRSTESDTGTLKSLRVACMIWRDPWMAAGPDTYVGDLLNVIGFRNVLEHTDDRYQKTTLEEVVKREPDVILLPDEPYEFSKEDKAFVEDFLAKRGVSARVELVVGSYLTWFGLRTMEGLEYLREIKKDLL